MARVLKVIIGDSNDWVLAVLIFLDLIVSCLSPPWLSGESARVVLLVVRTTKAQILLELIGIHLLRCLTIDTVWEH